MVKKNFDNKPKAQGVYIERDSEWDMRILVHKGSNVVWDTADHSIQRRGWKNIAIKDQYDKPRTLKFLQGIIDNYDYSEKQPITGDAVELIYTGIKIHYFKFDWWEHWISHNTFHAIEWTFFKPTPPPPPPKPKIKQTRTTIWFTPLIVGSYTDDRDLKKRKLLVNMITPVPIRNDVAITRFGYIYGDWDVDKDGKRILKRHFEFDREVKDYPEKLKTIIAVKTLPWHKLNKEKENLDIVWTIYHENRKIYITETYYVLDKIGNIYNDWNYTYSRKYPKSIRYEMDFSQKVNFGPGEKVRNITLEIREIFNIATPMTVEKDPFAKEEKYDINMFIFRANALKLPCVKNIEVVDSFGDVEDLIKKE